jgi:hypothetical protein
MVTIKASSKEDAKDIGRKLTNFTLDESQDPISFTPGEWIIFGTATGGEIKVGDDTVTTDPDNEMTTQDDDK